MPFSGVNTLFSHKKKNREKEKKKNEDKKTYRIRKDKNSE